MWWTKWKWEEALEEARAHACRNGRWDARLWPELELYLLPPSLLLGALD
jgi:hypothetical protein